MTLPLILCLVATVIPVFFSRLSSAPAWLSLQGLALAWVALTGHEVVSTLTPAALVDGSSTCWSPDSLRRLSTRL